VTAQHQSQRYPVIALYSYCIIISFDSDEG